ncbi:MAG: hypothetical protein AB7K52_15115 [Phycisphaerales bacterium]
MITPPPRDHGQPPAGRPSAAPTGHTPIPRINPGTGTSGATAPNMQPITVHGQRAPTPFWWGPTFGRHEPRRRGPIPGAYTPMGRPAVLVQPDYYPPPGEPRRFQSELAYGPLAPPPPSLPDDGFGPIRPITDPNPTSSFRATFRPTQEVAVSIGGFGDGLGTFVNGRIDSDRFRLGFTLGGNPFIVDRHGFAHDVGHFYRFSRHRSFHFGYPLFYSSGYDGRYSSYYAPIYGQLVTIDPRAIDPALYTPSQAPPVQFDESLLSDVERGHLALERGDAGDAIGFYSTHLAAHDSDADAMRWLATALLLNSKPAEGVAMMIMAYQTDPALAGSPLIASRFGGDAALNARFVAAVGYANSTRGSSAYFTASVLAQALEKPLVARRLLEKARAAGLDRAVHRAFEQVLAP